MKARVIKHSHKEKFLKKVNKNRLIRDYAGKDPRLHYQTISDRIIDVKQYVQTFDPKALAELPIQTSVRRFNMTAEKRDQYTEFSSMLWLHDAEGYRHAVYKDAVITDHLALPYYEALHKHDFVEILYVADGYIDQIIFGEECHLEAGDIMITDKKCEHLDVIDQGTGTIVFFCIQSDFLDTVLEYCDNTNVLYRFLLKALRMHENEQSFLHLKPIEADEIITFLAEQLVYEDFSDLPGNRDVIRWYLTRLLGRICENYVIQIYENESPDDKEKTILYEVERYIRAHLAEVSVQDLEKQFHYYRNYYNLLLKKYRQMSFREYVQKIRMEQAAYLLSETELSIKQIAFQVGYENTSFFYQLFDKFYNTSPQAYRKASKEEDD